MVCADKLLKGICEMFSAGGTEKHPYCVHEGGEAVYKARWEKNWGRARSEPGSHARQSKAVV